MLKWKRLSQWAVLGLRDADRIAFFGMTRSNVLYKDKNVGGLRYDHMTTAVADEIKLR